MSAVKIDPELVSFQKKHSLYVMDWNIKTGKIQVSNNWIIDLGYEVGSNTTVEWFSSVVHPDDMVSILCKLEARLSNFPDDNSGLEFRMKSKSGYYMKFVGLEIIVLSDLNGQPEHVIWAGQNGMTI